MSEINTSVQSITGRKIFFIHPNLTVFPETLCEDFMMMGYQCYFVMKDTIMPIDTKFDILINSFKDFVLYFNIDAPDPKPGVTWLQFIKGLNKKYGNKLLIGIMYSRRPSKQEEAQVGFLYENEARATCGAHMLEYDKHKNFATMMKAFEEVGALGRRKNVRVLCTANCKARFKYEYKDYFITINDISLSHFTCTCKKDELSIELNEKLYNIEFNIKGTHFAYDATVLFKRTVDEDKEIYVFAFTNKEGQFVLESKYQDMILPKLYGMMSEKFNEELMGFYEELKNKDEQQQVKK